jgi:phosphate starvation-inducible PhoH-like protein
LIEVIRIGLDGEHDAGELFGSMDVNLRAIEKRLGVEAVLRRDEIVIRGERAAEAQDVIRDLFWILDNGESIDAQKLEYVIGLRAEGMSYAASDFSRDIIAFTHRGKPVRAKTRGQKDYVEAIRSREIVFGIGPAGTGKTYLAVAMAVSAYKNKEAERIVLARPAVEAGERLGFLPGDLQEKVDPYLRPLYDALYDIMGRDTALRLKENETIEVVPLAYMRGRTLDNSFIILDEAQNTTREQMKMFLTRMGFGSRVVVTGDVTQIDLPEGRASGLLHAERVLGGVEEMAFCHLRDSDVVRHSLVKKIVGAYERYEARASERADAPARGSGEDGSRRGREKGRTDGPRREDREGGSRGARGRGGPSVHPPVHEERKSAPSGASPGGRPSGSARVRKGMPPGAGRRPQPSGAAGKGSSRKKPWKP